MLRLLVEIVMHLLLRVLLMMKVMMMMMMLLIGAIIDLRGSRTNIQWWSGINTAAIPHDAHFGATTVATADLLQISGERRVLDMTTFQRRRGEVAGVIIPVCQGASPSRAHSAAAAAAASALAHRIFVQRRVEMSLEVARAREPLVARVALI